MVDRQVDRLGRLEFNMSMRLLDGLVHERSIY